MNGVSCLWICGWGRVWQGGVAGAGMVEVPEGGGRQGVVVVVMVVVECSNIDPSRLPGSPDHSLAFFFFFSILLLNNLFILLKSRMFTVLVATYETNLADVFFFTFCSYT